MFKNDRPPRLALRFFRWFCRPEYREDIEGDLLERFYTDVQESGDAKARWLFAKNVLLLFRPGIIRHLNIFSQQNSNNMYKKEWTRLLLLNVFVILMILSPFIPGPSNKIVLWVSIIGQVAGTVGLLLVPLGLTWTILEVKQYRAKKEMVKDQRTQYNLALGAIALPALVLLCGALFLPNPMPKASCLFGLLLLLTGFLLANRQIKKWKDGNDDLPDHGARFMLAASATACTSFICLFLALFVLAGIGIIPGIAFIVLFFLSLSVIIGRLKQFKISSDKKFNVAPVYLFVVPFIAFLAFIFAVRPASDLSRNYAIERGEILIRSIEEYKNTTGSYPESIHALPGDIVKKSTRPFVMGIDGFRYNKIKDQYSLSFSQWLHLGSLEVIVLYDKSNLKDNLQGKFVRYDYKSDLHRVKSSFAAHDTKYENWRYYLVD